MPWFDLLTYLVPVFSVFLSYLLGRIQGSHVSQKEVLLARYNAFYVPYAVLIFKNFHLWVSFSAASEELQSIVIDHIVSNIQHLSLPAQDKAISICLAYWETVALSSPLAKKDNVFPDIPHLNNQFLRFTEQITAEALNISTKLKMPPLYKSIESLFSLSRHGKQE